jgi:NitT/TauT family transport system substrate-binding protein
MRRTLFIAFAILAALALAALPLAPRATVIAQDAGTAENPGGAPITTFDEYKYIPAESLPEVKSVSKYEWNDKDPTVKFPINFWIGWTPIIVANGGLKASDDSLFKKKYGFKVELQVIDDPVLARDAYASGASHILWGTLDMFVLFAPELVRDDRTYPRIFQQIDWSNGGDGIVARGGIKTVNDLRPKDGRKKVIALAQNSPSHYYVLNLLYYAGISPGDVDFRFTGNAFQAAAAFVNDKAVDACVSWAPDIYNISDAKKSGIPDVALISSTADAKRVIADVWAARADFAKDHPDVIEGLVAGIFEGMDLVKADKKKAARLFAESFNIKPEEAEGMFGDAHLTNCAENASFFLNRNNPANFEQTWKNITTIYGKSGFVDASKVPAFDKVMDPRMIEAVKEDFKHHKDEYTDTFATVTVDTKVDPSTKKEILTRTVRIHFAPNQHVVDPAYDPNAEAIVEEIGRMASQFGSSLIFVEGHGDRSKYEEAKKLGDAYFQRHSTMLKELSERRAKGVIEGVLKRFPDLKKEQFHAAGGGWEKPLANDALSRRVEIRVLAPEE